MLLLPHFPHSKLAKELHHTDHISQRWSTCARASPARDHSQAGQDINIHLFIHSFYFLFWWGGTFPILFLCYISLPDDSSRLLYGDIAVIDSPFQPIKSFNGYQLCCGCEYMSGNIKI